ncbi:MAG: tetratricopeptide repeat protein [Thermodesulfobacteriota bacterium]
MKCAGNNSTLFLNPLASLFLFLLLLVTLAVNLAVPIREGDLWWQMAYGRYLLANNTLIPDHTAFSWTPSDGSIIYCAWIAEIFLYVLYKIGGLATLYLLKYGCFLFFLYILWRQALKYQINSLPLTWLICLLSLLMIDQAAYIKPEIFSFVFILLTAWTWENFKSTDKHGYSCYLFPFYILLWVNIHGGFIFGLTYLVCLGCGEILNILFSSQQKLPLKKQTRFFFSLFLCFVAIFITPYGWKYPIQLVNNLFLGGLDVEHYEMVFAYKSILDRQLWPLHFIDYLVLAIIIFLFLLVVNIRKRGIDYSLILSNIIFLWLFTRFLRTTYFWGVIFAFSGFNLLYQLEPQKALWNKQRQKFTKYFIVILFLFLAFRSNYESVFCLHGPNWLGFGNSYINPQDESRFIKENFAGLRLGNDYDTGGYLLWDLWPDTKVFIDPRYFPFRDWFVEYREFVSGKNPSFIDKFPCDVWCLNLIYPVVSDFLQSNNWRLVYYGPSACIFARKELLKGNPAIQVSDSLSNIKSLAQAMIALQFTVRINDLNTSKKIVDSFNFNKFIPTHRSLVAQAYNSFGGVLLKNHQYDEAKKYFDKSLKLAPQYAPAYGNLGAASFIEERYDKAIEYYNIAIAIEPTNPEYYFNLALIMQSQGDVENAVINYRHSLRLDPNQANIYFFLGNIFLDKNNNQESIAYFLEALKISPNFLPVLIKLGQIYYQNREYNKSIEYFKRVLELQPDLKKTYFNIACLYAKLNDLDMAIHWLQLAVDKGYDNWDNIKKDPDLNSIRQTDDYRRIIESSPPL